MAGNNRGRVWLRRLDAPRWQSAQPTPRGWARISDAEVDGDLGVLVRNTSTGLYALLLAGGAIRALDARKVEAALSSSVRDYGAADAELARALKAWRADADITAAHASQMLGIPIRTLDGIEQGRGFRYPRLLLLALQARPDSANTVDTPGTRE